jgi:hypothetical protein
VVPHRDKKNWTKKTGQKTLPALLRPALGAASNFRSLLDMYTSPAGNWLVKVVS